MIKAIETSYAGCRFRSRLEARHAVFFDHLGIPWEYEPEGFHTPAGPYLPDFLIHPNTDRALWLEIKAKPPTEEEKAKVQALATGTGITAYLHFGGIEVPAPDLSHVTTFDEYMGPENWIYLEGIGWDIAATVPTWAAGLKPTAFRFNPKPPPRASYPESAKWWWTDCSYCGQVVLKRDGQIGWCPQWDAELPEGVEHPWPSFAHHTPRLLAAYTAARSARFEHGASG